jgi:ACT domain-containing protein
MSEQQIIVTVQGVDKVGIVATVTSVLAKYEVNIEDIKQTLMQ